MSHICGNCKLFEENKEQIKNKWEGKCNYEGYKKNKRFLNRNSYSDSCDKIDYIEEPFKIEPMKDGHYGDMESNRFE